jgi:violaxanthin de-epoxidase
MKTISCFSLILSSLAFISTTLAFVPHPSVPGGISPLYAIQNNKNDDVSSSNSVPAFAQLAKGLAATVLATTLTFNSLFAPVQPAQATDSAGSKQIVGCLLQKCQVPFLKCITNPKCLANVACINTCNNAADETGCQIKCGDIFENEIVGEFNKCAVSDMSCVPQKQDDGSYPIPTNEQVVSKFDTSLFNGRWYITAGQNKLFDTFPCQVHFFTETAPGKFFGKLNWRIQEPDGEFFTRDAVQEFIQDKSMPAHLVNHDNDYLHYQDDWYIIDYATDNNKDGVPPFAFVYYIGNNDAWLGYGGAVVYTRDSKLPESLVPRLRAAAEKVNFNFDKDFDRVDNTCGTMEKGEALVLREKFAGKLLIQTEEQLQAQATIAARMASNSAQTQTKQAEKALEILEKKVAAFEEEIIQDIAGVEKEIVKDVVAIEKEVVKDVVGVEKIIVKDVVAIEKEVVKDVVGIEKAAAQEVVVIEKSVSGIFGGKKQ